MSELTSKQLLDKLDALQNKLGNKTSDFPLWRSITDAMKSLMNFKNLKYYYNPTEEMKQIADEYLNKTEKLKKYLNTHPMSKKETEVLIYGRA